MRLGFTDTIPKPNISVSMRESIFALHKERPMVKSNVKSKLICFFSTKGIIHKSSLLLVSTLMQCSIMILRQLKEDVRGKCLEKWCKDNWFLHHDKLNIWCHYARISDKKPNANCSSSAIYMALSPCDSSLQWKSS